MIERARLEKIKKLMLKEHDFFEFLARGRRGFVYKIMPDLIVKVERDDIGSQGSIENEYNMLEQLKDYDYFPKIIKYNKSLRFLVREFVKGDLIEKYLHEQSIILECLKMCRILDIKGINQGELTNPFKHIFVNNGKIMMIDFERAKPANNPKNVSQFVQYLIRNKAVKKSAELISAVKKYKNSCSDKIFNDLFLFVKLNFIH
ncbi:hypothetical protein COX58_00145 [archaeon CG_4_10_14_0_2_um_filter_Archaea_38_6]|nr:MAG: hypothetical protein COS83_02950 [archaeon CG07_land_8_20_14_0_80_38_8]PIU88782.1 MAG: hypothetical protein COS64_02765 [archaeon CG06_land_8_20_14_3_00_37_11]PIX43186.1 MAG: hypothetical protein COZ55_01450 [archaeon CG_4_8_14_3_um_filter_38_5]PJA23155.1 MAG: hypothetical protein COX58_00145 [archaeon CG_4_10_14_0_2_um_filter_Archaea_38_6]